MDPIGSRVYPMGSSDDSNILTNIYPPFHSRTPTHSSSLIDCYTDILFIQFYISVMNNFLLSFRCRSLSLDSSCCYVFIYHLLFLIFNLYQHLMYSLDLKRVDKVVYRRENSSIQAKVSYDELAKIQSRSSSVTHYVWAYSILYFSET